MNVPESVLLRVIAFLLVLVALTFYNHRSWAHDPDHPENMEWYQSIKMPDDPERSCCGIGDAYFCNDMQVVDGKTFCTITDDRNDEVRGRVHIPVGTKILIPPEKLIRGAEAKKGNPTNNGVIWAKPSAWSDGYTVFCYVMPDLT
jgi:hypothetical protein